MITTLGKEESKPRHALALVVVRFQAVLVTTPPLHHLHLPSHSLTSGLITFFTTLPPPAIHLPQATKASELITRWIDDDVIVPRRNNNNSSSSNGGGGGGGSSGGGGGPSSQAPLLWVRAVSYSLELCLHELVVRGLVPQDTVDGQVQMPVYVHVHACTVCVRAQHTHALEKPRAHVHITHLADPCIYICAHCTLACPYANHTHEHTQIEPMLVHLDDDDDDDDTA